MTIQPTQADYTTLNELYMLEWIEADGRPNPDALDLLATHRIAAETRIAEDRYKAGLVEGARMAIEAAAIEAEREEIVPDDGRYILSLRRDAHLDAHECAEAIRALDPQAIVERR